MEKVDLSKINPFAGYTGDFSSFFSFGPEYDDWVTILILNSILPAESAESELIELADIGAGSCYWPISFLKKRGDLMITAVDPSEALIFEQADRQLRNAPGLGARLNRVNMTAQDFAHLCGSPEFSQRFRCI